MYKNLSEKKTNVLRLCCNCCHGNENELTYQEKHAMWHTKTWKVALKIPRFFLDYDKNMCFKCDDKNNIIVHFDMYNLHFSIKINEVN